MFYKSTRGGSTGTSFEEALFSGYAPDGGLFVPESIPELTPKLLMEWRSLKLTYPEVITKIVRMFVGPEEITNDSLHNCVRRAFATFAKDEVIGITPVKDLAGNEVNIAELFHGRTSSFKDLGLSVVGQFMGHFMSKKNDHVIVLVATAGDTGSAAIDAFRMSKNIDIIVLYPKGKISQVAEWHMRAVLEENVHIYEVEGTTDDADIPIMQCFPASGLSSVNSINWARILIQMAHYVYLYLLEGSEIDIVVPTGAAGNLTSGVLACKMGLPVKLHFTTNKNDCVELMVSKGILDMDRVAEPSPANAMDAGSSYNVERVLYLFSNSETIKELMKRRRNVQIPADILSGLRNVIKGSTSVGDQEIYETMKTCWDVNQYLICPHTATAMHYFTQRLSGKPNVYVLATARPQKFVESVEKSGLPASVFGENGPFKLLETCPKVQPKLMRKGEDWFKILQDDIKSIQSNR